MTAEAKIPIPDVLKDQNLQEGGYVSGYLKDGEMVLSVELNEKSESKKMGNHSYIDWANRADIPEYVPNPEVLADPRAAAILDR